MTTINSNDAKAMLKEKLLKMKKQIQKSKQQKSAQERKSDYKKLQESNGQNSQFSKGLKQQGLKSRKPIQLKERKPEKSLVETINFKKSEPSVQIAPWRKESQFVVNKPPPVRNLNEITKLSELPQKKLPQIKDQQSKKQPAIFLPAREREQNQAKNFFDYFPTFIERKKKKAGQLIDLKVCTLSEIVDYCYIEKIIVEEDYHSYLFNKGPYIQKSYLQKFASNKLHQFTFTKTRFTLLDHRRLGEFLNKLTPTKYRLGDRPFNIHPDITNFLEQIYRLPAEDYWDICSKVDEKYNLKWWKEILKKFQVCSPNLTGINRNPQVPVNPNSDQKVCQLLPSFNLNQRPPKEDTTLKRSKQPTIATKGTKDKEKIKQKNKQKDGQSDSLDSIDKNSDISEKLSNLDNSKDSDEKEEKSKKKPQKKLQVNNKKQKTSKSNSKANKKVEEKKSKKNKKSDDQDDEDDENQQFEDSFKMSKSDFSLGELGNSSSEENIFDDQDEDNEKIKSQNIKKGNKQNKNKEGKKQDKGKTKQPKDDDFFSSLDQDELGQEFDDDLNLGSDDDMSLSINDSSDSNKGKKSNPKRKIEVKNQKKNSKDTRNQKSVAEKSKNSGKSKSKKVKQK